MPKLNTVEDAFFAHIGSAEADDLSIQTQKGEFRAWRTDEDHKELGNYVLFVARPNNSEDVLYTHAYSAMVEFTDSFSGITLKHYIPPKYQPQSQESNY